MRVFGANRCAPDHDRRGLDILCDGGTISICAFVESRFIYLSRKAHFFSRFGGGMRLANPLLLSKGQIADHRARAEA